MKPTGGLRPIPAPYLVNLGLGLIALPCLGIGLGGILLGRAGYDPFSSWNAIGLPCFITGFLILYAMRLIFWRRSSPALAAGVRKALTAVMLLLVIATFGAVIIVLTPGTTPGWTLIFVGYAVLGLIPNLIWLVRYRRVDGH